MITVNEFLDVCKVRTKSDTDSNLARKVDITRAALSAYRKGASFPSDVNMLRLARRAKIDPTECLILLNIWRAEDAPKSVYIEMMRSVRPRSQFL